MNQWMLWARFAAINLFGAAALALAWINGWVQAVIAGDNSRISILIFLLFIVGLVATAWRIEKVTSELDNIARGRGGRLDAYRSALARSGMGNATRAMELRLFGRIVFIRQIGNALVMLGLIGTVVGFVQALNGVDPGKAGDASSIGGMVGTMIEGMGVALYTTLVGSVLNLWLTANYQILATGTANLAATLIDAAHDDPESGPGEAVSEPVRTRPAAGGMTGLGSAGMANASLRPADGAAHV
ncbi:MotA/TolQ/ExbB proton channel family protein [Azospirillum sp. SYSU D00513]|uniref:MotA/TolQ/ExbB proton channel family protein n=1 Tax=Azospirillum sp. SYSU D00513 TaxID=2812561 RepID=UPI001FFEEBD1|nr:MotA/TolQ/ExbB proton channel family protein [Azospirillum sp. SYSU D00513]